MADEKGINIALATLIVNGIVSLLAVLPQLVVAIQNMTATEEDKDILLARIKAAQAGIPEW